jgi:hypothetical protein
MKRQIVIGVLSAAALAGVEPNEARAVSPPVLSAQTIAGPALTSEVRYRQGRYRHRAYYPGRRGSNVGPAIAAGAMLGLVGTLAAATVTPSYSYGYPYDGYGYGYPYGGASYSYGYPYGRVAYSYPGYGSYPAYRYGYAYPYRRAYYPRGVYRPRAYYGRGDFYSRRVHYGRPGFEYRRGFGAHPPQPFAGPRMRRF